MSNKTKKRKIETKDSKDEQPKCVPVEEEAKQIAFLASCKEWKAAASHLFSSAESAVNDTKKRAWFAKVIRRIYIQALEDAKELVEDTLVPYEIECEKCGKVNGAAVEEAMDDVLFNAKKQIHDLIVVMDKP